MTASHAESRQGRNIVEARTKKIFKLRKEQHLLPAYISKTDGK